MPGQIKDVVAGELQGVLAERAAAKARFGLPPGLSGVLVLRSRPGRLPQLGSLLHRSIMRGMDNGRPTVYLETSVVSYLTSKPSRDLVVAAHQQITREWWERRDRFVLFVSEAVLQEAGGGDPSAAAERLAAVRDLAVLAVGSEVATLARRLLTARALPEKALLDAVHIAVTAVRGIDYLLTWNCTHLANASLRVKVEAVCRAAGYEPPVICTPEELMED